MMTDRLAKLSVSDCIDRILDTEAAVIVMHTRPDGDTVGSASALCKIFRALGKTAEYACDTPIPRRLAFLTEGLTSAESLDGKTLITCDVASPSQLGRLSELVPRVAFSIDHHQCSSPFAPNCTVSDASSAGEVVYDIVRGLASRGLISLTAEIAYPLYAAISSDTGGFVYSSASPKAYRAAAELIETGIDHADINHRLFASKSEKQLRAEAFTTEKLVSVGNISYSAITLADMERLGIEAEYFDTAIDVVRSLEGTEVAFTVKEVANGSFRISLRSTGFDVAAVASLFSGGGHVRAAGCTVTAETKDAAAEKILNAIKNKNTEE